MKPFHKHVGHHMKRVAQHYTKYLFERDTILATISVFVFLILVGFIKINFYVLNPMKLALKDFDFNDIAYSKLGKTASTPIDKSICIVNIGHWDRAQLAGLIEKVRSMGPRVMGLDAYFDGPREPEKDSLFRAAVEGTKNLVVISRLAYSEEEDKMSVLPDYFDSSYHAQGFANLAADTVGTVRIYAPFEEVNGKEYPHFTSEIVKLYDHNAYEKLESRHKPTEIISYSRSPSQYIIVEPEELMMDMVDSSLFKNKIVLLGYVNRNPDDIEDKKFTPMNVEFAGKAKPDMNGVVVLANIISMVMEGHYIKKMPKYVAWLSAILIGWLHMSLFVRFYLEDHIWFHLVAKIVQLVSAIVFAYLGIILYTKYGIKLDMKYTLYVIILAVDIIYFYEAFAVWLHKKTGFKTVFHLHSHH